MNEFPLYMVDAYSLEVNWFEGYVVELDVVAEETYVEEVVVVVVEGAYAAVVVEEVDMI